MQQVAGNQPAHAQVAAPSVERAPGNVELPTVERNDPLLVQLAYTGDLLTSVAGGIAGYAIGALLYDSLGAWLFHLYGLDKGADQFREAYAHYGHWVILLKGLTPIPYKLVTITSGFAGYDLFWFVVLSLITRGARFFILAGLVRRYGVGIRTVLDRHLNAVAAICVAVAVLGFVAFRYLI